MATPFRNTFTKPLPEGAEPFTRKGEQFARWTDGKGKTRTEKVTTGKDGLPRLLIEANTYTPKYRDGMGIVREAATGCRDETAPRNVLAGLLKRAENVKSGITTAPQDAVIDHQKTYRKPRENLGLETPSGRDGAQRRKARQDAALHHQRQTSDLRGKNSGRSRSRKPSWRAASSIRRHGSGGGYGNPERACYQIRTR